MWNMKSLSKVISFILIYTALNTCKRDWKKVEIFIGTRSGAQIRSHAQKFFTRIEKLYPDVDIDQYIENKAKAIQERKANAGDNQNPNHSDISEDEGDGDQKEENKTSEKSVLLIQKNSSDKSPKPILH